MSLFFKKGKSLPMSKVAAALIQDPSIKLIDVRTKEEYRGGHIPKAVNVPLEAIHQIVKTVPDKNAPLFVYCLSGGRSSEAVIHLDRLGFTNITNIGGIMSWNGPVER